MIYIKDDIGIGTVTLPGKKQDEIRLATGGPARNWLSYSDLTPETNGVLENNFLLRSITREIENAVGSKSVHCIRSWWIVLDKDDKITKHAHRYQTKNRTISGCLYIDGKSCPLLVKEPAKSPRIVENKQGRLVLFDGFVEHWTESYKFDATRYTIAFDFLINDQPACDCKETQYCVRCIQNNPYNWFGHRFGRQGEVQQRSDKIYQVLMTEK